MFNSNKYLLVCVFLFLLSFYSLNGQTREFVFKTYTFNSIDVGDNSTPEIADIDGDGLLDLIIGEKGGKIMHYVQDSENPTSFSPAISANLQNSSGSDIDVGDNSAPILWDIDGDGLLDLLIGQSFPAQIEHYEQTAVNAVTFDLITNKFSNIDMGQDVLWNHPTLTDIDGDGLLDLIIGKAYDSEEAGRLSHFEQNSANSYSFTERTDYFNNIDVGDHSAPRVTDFFDDDILDLIIGEFNININYYKQETANSLTFTNADNNILPNDGSGYQSTVFADLDGDNLLDLLVGEQGGEIIWYEAKLTITTDEVTSISPTSADCGGSTLLDGTGTMTARGVCWGTSSNPTVSNSHTNETIGIGDFSSSITGLTKGTTYYVRSYCTNKGTTSYGTQKSFTTDDIPTVTTNSVSNISNTEADCGGEVTSDNGDAVTARGVCWSTNQNPTIANSKTTDGSGIGSFTSSITGLSLNTLYYVRAYATNSAGTAYGNQQSFTTTKPEIEVWGNLTLITDGDDSPSVANDTDFGVVALSGGTESHTFTIKNTDAGTLGLSGDPRVAVLGVHASDFTVTVQPAATVAANNGTTTFEVTFDPSENTDRYAEISIGNDDPDENPYNFSVYGRGDNQTNPSVTLYTPEDDGETIVRQSLVLEFDEVVTVVSGKNITINDENNYLFETITADDSRVTVNGAEVTINPNGTFVEGVEYNVQIEAGSFVDYLSNDYAGILNNTTWNFTANRAEDPGYALDFDGVDDRIPVANTLPEEGTIEFWIKTSSLSGTSKYLLQSSSANPWNITLNSNNISVSISTSGSISSSGGIEADKWHHVVFSWNRKSTLVDGSLYINGNLKDAGYNYVWQDPGSGFTIGAKHSTGTYPFNGVMDEFRIWNDIRSSAEIEAYMHKGLSGNESGLQIFYPFDETNGTDIYDYSGNTNDASALGLDDNSWVASGGPFGEEGVPVRTTSVTPIGVTGKQLRIQITDSEHLGFNYLGIYTSGNGNSHITNDDFGSSGATQRSNIIWGVAKFGDVTADLVFDYTNIAGITDQTKLKLLKRNDATNNWTDVTSSASQNTDNHTFTMTGVYTYSEFSIGDDGSNPVPVELASFKASMKNKAVVLNWQTATEVNNYGFEVQRLQDSKIEKLQDWEIIGFVEGHGNSNSVKEYSFVDSYDLSGTIQYRLKQIDTDGSYEYSSSIGVEMDLPKEFRLGQNYPNPFNPSTIIKYEIPSVKINDGVEVTLKIYNTLGQEVATLIDKKQIAGNYEVHFNASDLTSGIYIYRLVSGQFVASKKLLLLK